MNDLSLSRESSTTSQMFASQQEQHQQRPVNVGESERWWSIIGGSGLLAYGLRGGSWLRLFAAACGAGLVYRGWTGHCDVYGQLGVNSTVKHHDRVGVRAQHGVKVTRSVHINRDRHELYQQWRKLENLPGFMRHLVSVTPLDEKRSHWIARAPMDQTLEWDAEIITDRAGEVIAWRSLPDSEVDTAGSVHFSAPASGHGTDLTVEIKYDPPGGKAVAKLAGLAGMGLEQELTEDLRAFKQHMETGEVATSAQRPEPGSQGGAEQF